jgi:hypothetical protein
MGQIADVISGLLCDECGVFIDGVTPGYPRKCGDCKVGKKKGDKKCRRGTHKNRSKRRGRQ